MVSFAGSTMSRFVTCFIYFASLLATTAATFACPSLFNWYPDTEDCSRFYRCVWGMGESFTCAPGTWWSHELLTCDFKAKVKCSAGLTKQIGKLDLPKKIDQESPDFSVDYEIGFQDLTNSKKNEEDTTTASLDRREYVTRNGLNQVNEVKTQQNSINDYSNVSPSENKDKHQEYSNQIMQPNTKEYSNQIMQPNTKEYSNQVLQPNNAASRDKHKEYSKQILQPNTAASRDKHKEYSNQILQPNNAASRDKHKEYSNQIIQPNTKEYSNQVLQPNNAASRDSPNLKKKHNDNKRTRNINTIEYDYDNDDDSHEYESDYSYQDINPNNHLKKEQDSPIHKQEIAISEKHPTHQILGTHLAAKEHTNNYQKWKDQHANEDIILPRTSTTRMPQITPFDIARKDSYHRFIISKLLKIPIYSDLLEKHRNFINTDGTYDVLDLDLLPGQHDRNSRYKPFVIKREQSPDPWPLSDLFRAGYGYKQIYDKK